MATRNQSIISSEMDEPEANRRPKSDVDVDQERVECVQAVETPVRAIIPCFDIAPAVIYPSVDCGEKVSQGRYSGY